ncbi:hypothetical protein CB0940_10099 [Cercospora beticola]|uniref:Zn(2)-C6 fungal-type domain-containing protein n=1 Tax=Cercospora beticola TaxID=122368 RepID=A0A2G5HUC5_CERBT|nr:hypothetical protein CB0940_10099 [Cercospora beticola]PIA96139.1 hypothetical protein CB0940_10099 [Cercospora beticola]WPB06803.1 hypothetical protein RHO25_011463 [Cercospora beticola]
MMKRDGLDKDGQSEKVKKTLRGRAEKACVRCRAKKRTCDGGNPCLRCKESHSACYFSDWHYTVPYPREYVEYLEEQQEQLSNGLMTLYSILKESNIQTVPALPDKPEAQDLLAALKGLKLDTRSQSVSSSQRQDGTHMQMNEMSMAGQPDYRQGSAPVALHHHPATSPLQPAPIFMPQLGPPGMSSNITSHASKPTPAQYAPPYRPFDAPHPLPAHVLGPHYLPSHTIRHDFLPSGENSAMRMTDSWQPSPSSLTPSTNTPLDNRSHNPTPLASTPGMFAEGQHEGMYMQPYAHQHLSQPWAWEAAAAMHAGPTSNSHYDPRVLSPEAIEARGEMVAPHESQAPYQHG